MTSTGMRQSHPKGPLQPSYHNVFLGHGIKSLYTRPHPPPPSGHGYEVPYPSSEGTPGGHAGTQVPQDPDDNDTRFQPVGSGLENKAQALYTKDPPSTQGKHEKHKSQGATLSRVNGQRSRPSSAWSAAISPGGREQGYSWQKAAQPTYSVTSLRWGCQICQRALL